MSLSVSVKEIVDKTNNTLLSAHQNWLRVSIEDICEVLNGYAFKSTAFNNKKIGMPLIRIRDVQESSVETYFSGDFPKEYVIKSGDILVGMDGDFNCKKWNNIPALLNQRVCKIEIVSKYFHKDFLYYALPPYLTEINQWTSAVTVKHLSSFSIKEIPLPLPPLNEQKRIVAKLDAIMPRIEAVKARLDKVPGILKRFRQSVLTAAVTGKLTEQWRLSACTAQAGEEHPEVGEWEEKTLQDVTDYQGGYAYKSTKFIESSDNQVLKIANVKVYGVDIDIAPSFIDDEYAIETERFMLKENDVIISMTGTRNKRDYGFNGIIRQTTRKLFLNQRVARLRCHEKQILPEILSLILKTPEFRDYFFKDETGNVNQGNVGADALKLAPLLLPPLEEQIEIVRQVDKLFALADKVEAHYQKAKARVDKLSQSVLAKAFRGELVPQDPNDLPAAELLKQILAEKDKMAAQLKKRKTKNVKQRK